MGEAYKCGCQVTSSLELDLQTIEKTEGDRKQSTQECWNKDGSGLSLSIDTRDPDAKTAIKGAFLKGQQIFLPGKGGCWSN